MIKYISFILLCTVCGLSCSNKDKNEQAPMVTSSFIEGIKQFENAKLGIEELDQMSYEYLFLRSKVDCLTCVKIDKNYFNKNKLKYLDIEYEGLDYAIKNLDTLYFSTPTIIKLKDNQNIRFLIPLQSWYYVETIENIIVKYYE